MNQSILYTSGLGNSSIYMRLSDSGKFYDFLARAWVANEGAGCRVYLSEYAATTPEGSYYYLPNIAMPSGGPFAVEFVLGSTVIFNDIYVSELPPSPAPTRGMTFLQLVQRLRQECGVAGDGPSTVMGQTREMKRLCDWINISWQEIQQEHQEWEFLRKPITFNTVAGKQSYSLADIGISEDFAHWRNESFRCYQQSAGIATEIILGHVQTYADFRDYYMLSSRRLVTARPTVVCVAPDRSLAFGFIPNDVYVVSGEYYQQPQELTADGDVPLMPERYHMAIVYKAMQKYGLFEAANEQIEAGKQGYAMLMNRLRCDQTPMLQMGGSLI